MGINEKLSGARDATLDAWLTKVEAVCLWQQTVKGVGTVECWRAGHRVCLVLRYSKGHGWDIFTPAQSPKTDDSLKDAAARLFGKGTD